MLVIEVQPQPRRVPILRGLFLPKPPAYFLNLGLLTRPRRLKTTSPDKLDDAT
jgi:hypothetical protein